MGWIIGWLLSTTWKNQVIIQKKANMHHEVESKQLPLEAKQVIPYEGGAKELNMQINVSLLVHQNGS